MPRRPPISVVPETPSSKITALWSSIRWLPLGLGLVASAGAGCKRPADPDKAPGASASAASKPSDQAPPKESKALVELARKQLVGIETYRAKFDLTMYGEAVMRQQDKAKGAAAPGPRRTRFVADVTGKRPNMLALRLRSVVPDSAKAREATPVVDIHAVFDGSTLWTANRLKQPGDEVERTQIVRLDQKRLAQTSRPFDLAGFKLGGGALWAGYGVIGTFEQLLRRYDFEPLARPGKVGEVACYELVGRYPAARFVDDLAREQPDLFSAMIQARARNQEQTVVNSMRAGFGTLRTLRLWLSVEGLVPSRWQLGRADDPGVDIALRRFERNVKLPADAFAFPEEQKKIANDMTEQLAQGAKETRETLAAHKKAVEQAKATLLKALATDS